MSLQYPPKTVRDEIGFLRANKYESFLQVVFNTLGIKVSYKVILRLLMGMVILKVLKVATVQYPYNIFFKRIAMKQNSTHEMKYFSAAAALIVF